MTATVETKTLRAAMARLGRVVEARNTIPILANILIEAAEGALTLTATDLDCELRLTVDASVETPFALTLPAQALKEFAGKTPDGAQIRLAQEDHFAKLSAGRARLTLPVLPATDFPRLTPKEGGTEIAIAPGALAAQLGFCLWATSTEETRYYLNGVYLHPHDGRLRMVATNGHCLARIDGIDAPEDLPGEIVPTKAAAFLAGLDGDGAGTLTVAESGIAFEADGLRFSSKTVDGKFPDYARVIPDPGPNAMCIEADADAMHAALGVASIAASTDKTRALKLSPGDDALALSSANTEGRASATEIAAVTTGEAHSFGANAKYLADCLGAFAKQTLTIAQDDAASPALFTCQAHPDRLAVVMPMRV